VLSGVDVVVAVLADHKGFAAPLCHDRCPPRLFRLAELVEVRELSDVMDLDILRSLAELASAREESGDQFLGADCSGWVTVVKDRFLLPPEGYATVLCDQWSAGSGGRSM
jgi:hypothetical protein